VVIFERIVIARVFEFEEIARLYLKNYKITRHDYAIAQRFLQFCARTLLSQNAISSLMGCGLTALGKSGEFHFGTYGSANQLFPIWKQFK